MLIVLLYVSIPFFFIVIFLHLLSRAVKDIEKDTYINTNIFQKEENKTYTLM